MQGRDKWVQCNVGGGLFCGQRGLVMLTCLRRCGKRHISALWSFFGTIPFKHNLYLRLFLVRTGQIWGHGDIHLCLPHPSPKF